MAKMKKASYKVFMGGPESKPTVYSSDCYICNDAEYKQFGLPLCRRCPRCGGHIAADSDVCDDCGGCGRPE